MRSGTTSGWFGLARNLRTRLLLSYLFLIVMCGGLSVIGIREALNIGMEGRVESAIRQEFQEIDRLLADGRDPQTGERFTSLDIALSFYYQRNVPSDEEAFLAFVDGRAPWMILDRFPLSVLPSNALPLVSQPADAMSGQIGQFDTTLGVAYYGIHPVELAGTTGTFVVTILPAAEHNEIRDLQTYGVLAVVAIVLIASAFAWYLTGLLLIPVRQLTETARLISRADQFDRVPVRGTDEAGEMARTFNAMLDRLELVLRKQREFVLDASHELRGPLTISMGNLGLIEHGVIGDDPVERAETIALVTDELERMGRIVEDLSLLADTAHPDFLRPESIDLAGFTQELAGKISVLAVRDWQVEVRADSRLTGDRHRLTQAVINLAINAVHHTVETDTITLSCDLVDGAMRISLADTGVGIAEADLVRIFERFQRGADAHRRYRGSGLGLAIVEALATAHGGRVEVVSRLRHGATFTLILPPEPSRKHEPWHEF